jgi:rhodanese-related sulfurtransferase
VTGPPRLTVDELLAQARDGLERVSPIQAAAVVEAGGLLVDTRPDVQRQRDGDIPGAIIVERNHLEWRLDPASAHRHPAVNDDYDRPVVVVCDEGFASSLAAATLQRLGLRNATDLDGGFQAWAAAGLPVTPPTQ